VRQDALLAHATQVDPNVGFWFGVPDEVADRVEPYDTYVLDHSVVATQSPEHDLFAGVRA
jgi:mycothiol S-conjugate amidase